MSSQHPIAPPADDAPGNERREAPGFEDTTVRSRRVRKRELIYGGIGAVAGFIVLPISIYTVGTLLLGPYAGGKSLGAFFAAFYGNLGHAIPRTWFIALSPYLAICVVRLSFRRMPSRTQTTEPPAAPTESAQVDTQSPRREPFISS